MRIGVDFDNTIAIYDHVFYRAALDKGLITQDVPSEKKSVKDAVQKGCGNDAWTELQGIVYGLRMREAAVAEGFFEFASWFRSIGGEIFVISHKTEYPAKGDRINLRAPALEWLKNHRFLDASGIGLNNKEHVFFESTLREKLARIQDKNVEFFIDDHPDVLNAPGFPKKTTPILYDSESMGWPQIHAFFKGRFLEEKSIRDSFESHVGTRIRRMTPLTGGVNSRVYKIVDHENHSHAAKVYLSRSNDKRDRLNTEYQSLKLLSDHGIGCVPNPRYRDKSLQLACYSYAEGVKLKSSDITKEACVQFVSFLARIQKIDATKCDWQIPKASEACFTITDYLNTLSVRLENLKKIAHKDLSFLIRDRLEPCLSQVRQDALKQSQAYKLDIDKELSDLDKRLSPSDLGFHNVLWNTKTQNLIFIDFEYFGWDDPVKMLSDPILQPDIPIIGDLRSVYLNACVKNLCLNKEAVTRFNVVFPILGLRWCFIVLNIFLWLHTLVGTKEYDMKLAAQITKARHMIDVIEGHVKTRDYTKWIK